VKKRRMTVFERDAVMANVIPLSDQDDGTITYQYTLYSNEKSS
jgi:hypothetical protein